MIYTSRIHASPEVPTLNVARKVAILAELLRVSPDYGIASWATFLRASGHAHLDTAKRWVQRERVALALDGVRFGAVRDGFDSSRVEWDHVRLSGWVLERLERASTMILADHLRERRIVLRAARREREARRAARRAS